MSAADEPTRGPHGQDKPGEPEDPMALTGSIVTGDPGAMCDGLVEEFARLGLPASRIHALFADPEFEATHALVATLGAEAVHQRVSAVLARCGVWQVRMTESAKPQPAEGGVDA